MPTPDPSTSGISNLFEWNLAGNTLNFLDNPNVGRPTFTGNFTGTGREAVLFFYPGDFNWWLGVLSENNQFTWSHVGNTRGQFNFPGNGQLSFTGDFTGSGRDEILFFEAANQNWWLGQFSESNQLNWSFVGRTFNFLDNPNTGRPTFAGNFTVTGQRAILFFYPGDKNWWMGTISEDKQFVWSHVGNTGSLFTFSSDGQPSFIGDFTGAGQDQFLFFESANQKWWLGKVSDTNRLSWRLIGRTFNFLDNPNSGRPTFAGNFTGTGQQTLLFFYPGDNNWWLGRVPVSGTEELSWSHAGNTGGLFTFPSNGKTTFIADFTGSGKDEIIFFDEDNQSWWLGQSSENDQFRWSRVQSTEKFPTNSSQPVFIADFTGSGSGQADFLFFRPDDRNWWLGKSLRAVKMFESSSGYLSAQYMDSYNFSGDDFSLSLMLQPRSAGTIISAGTFDLTLNSNGALQFSVYRSAPSQSTRVVSGATNLINTTQCNIITCIAPLSGAPSIYMDGQLLTTTTQTIAQRPEEGQLIFIGNNAAGSSQYKGGIMNIGLWNRTLDERELILAGYGQAGDSGIGPVALWFLNSSFVDDSFNDNALQAGTAAVMFISCFNCISLYGPNSYSLCQIEGVVMAGPVNMITYAQNIQVSSDAVALLAAVTDESGYARFPDGVFVQITDPAGRIYNQDASPADGSLFVKTQPVAGYATHSLFSLLVNNPARGTWVVTITAPSNIFFLFQIQAYPGSDIISSQVTALQGVRQHRRRRFQLQGWGTFLLGSALFLIGAVALIATSGTGVAAAAALMAVGAGIMIATKPDMPINEQTITIRPPVLDIYAFSVQELNNRHVTLKGKVWDTARGQLNGNWILQSGTVSAESSTIQTFKDLVNGAQNSIDILIFGSPGEQFKTELKNFLAQRTSPLTVRVFSGMAPDLEASSFLERGKKIYKTALTGSFHVEKAFAIFKELVDIKNIPGNIDLFVGAGEVPFFFPPNIAITRGWEHHKIIIVDGKKTIIGGMNFSEDSLKSATDPNNAVNDISAVVEGGAAGSIQHFVNNFWDNLFAVPLTSKSDFPIFNDNPTVSGAYYLPPYRLERKSQLAFALLTSKAPQPDIKSAITALNSRLPGATTSGNDNVKMITVGRRSGYLYRDKEPGDIAILNLIRRAESSLYISQQALGYPTGATEYIWDEAILEIRQAMQRGVTVSIIVSWTPDRETNAGLDGGYTSEQAYKLRGRILTDTHDVSDKLEIYNFPARNHAKIVVVDTEAVYIGSQNLYPTKTPVLNAANAASRLAYLSIDLGTPTVMSALMVITVLAYMFPEYTNLNFEVGLGECGIIICDTNKTREFIATYWNEKWRIASNPR